MLATAERDLELAPSPGAAACQCDVKAGLQPFETVLGEKFLMTTQNPGTGLLKSS